MSHPAKSAATTPMPLPSGWKTTRLGLPDPRAIVPTTSSVLVSMMDTEFDFVFVMYSVEATPGHPVRIGARVSLGHNARVFGATVDEGSLIAIGATVRPGARIGSQSIVAANATVPEDLVVPPRTLVIGHGRLLREVTDAEIERIEHGAADYARLAREYRSGVPSPSARGSG